MKSAERPAGPIFVVGMNGSGTTLLLECLGQHPEIYSFPRETKFLPTFLHNESKFGDLDNDENFLHLLDALRNHVIFTITEGSSVPLPRDWHRIARDAGSAFDAIMKHFAAKENKTRWCEKSPRHALHMKLLSKYFPASCFIHVIRDGRDCAQSLQRRWRLNPYRTINIWKDLIQRARSQGEELNERYFEVKYEDLSTRPKEVMEAICHFLSIDFHESMLFSSDRYLDQNSYREDSEFGIQKNVKKWKAYFGRKQISKLEKFGGKCLQDLGYEIVTEPLDAKPSILESSCWFVGDLFRITSRQARSVRNKETMIIQTKKFRDKIDQFLAAKR